MQKNLAITVSKPVYDGLHKVIGRWRISKFIEKLVKPHLVGKELDDAYKEMAADEAREAEALDWVEGTLGGKSE